MNAEDSLRKRIKRILSLAKVGGSQPQVVDQIMSLFLKYRNASKTERAAVFAKTKKEILKSLETPQAIPASKGER
jgi:hypothetical protein